MLYRDKSDEIVSKLANIRANLIKEIYEANGIYLGKTNVPIEYRNYLSSNPMVINGDGSLISLNGDYNFDPSSINPEMLGQLEAQLSTHFKLKDFLATSHGIHNNLPDTKEHEISLYKLAQTLVEPIYELAGGNIRINSAYRNKYVNAKVGGAQKSQHLKGEAVDIDATNGLTNRELFLRIFNAIADGKLKVGQLLWEKGSINEPGWIHVSLPYHKTNQILRILQNGKGGGTEELLANLGITRASNMC